MSPQPQDASPMMCLVCSKPLDYRVDGSTGAVSWIHPSDKSHPAIAVPIADSGPAIHHCDFCYELEPKWWFACADFPTSVMTYADHVDHHFSRGAWAACDTCKELVERKSRKGLLARALKRHQPLDPLSEVIVERGLRALHANFFHFMRGKAVRVDS